MDNVIQFCLSEDTLKYKLNNILCKISYNPAAGIIPI